MYSIEILVLLFFIYSFVGWIIEIINEIVTTHKFVNRGFLIGPYCPIYGCGGLLITLLLTKYNNDPVVLFVLSVVICSILEYFTSYVMEKLFNARWWDYSNRKYNINGRICLSTMVPFGLLGALMIYFVNPFIINIFSVMSINTLKYISIILLIIFLSDIIVSSFILNSIKDDINKIDADNTEEISLKVKESLLSFSWIKRRLFLAFPDAKYIKEKIKVVVSKNKAKQEKIKEDLNEQIKKIKKESDNKIKRLKENANNKIKK